MTNKVCITSGSAGANGSSNCSISGSRHGRVFCVYSSRVPLCNTSPGTKGVALCCMLASHSLVFYVGVLYLCFP